jgi:transposase
MPSSRGDSFKVEEIIPFCHPLLGIIEMVGRGMPKFYHLHRADLLAEAATQLSLCKDAYSQKRLFAMRLAATGQFTVVQIAEQLGISRRRFFDWMHALKTDGLAGLLQRQHGGGRPRRLSSEQIVDLEEMLLQGTVAHGWENNLWTTLRVRELIKRHFGIQFCRSYVWNILTKYLNWSAIRPV